MIYFNDYKKSKTNRISKYLELTRAFHQSEKIAIPLDIDPSNGSKKCKTLEKYMNQIEKVLDYNNIQVDLNIKGSKTYIIEVKNDGDIKTILVTFYKKPSNTDVIKAIESNDIHFGEGTSYKIQEAIPTVIKNIEK